MQIVVDLQPFSIEQSIAVYDDNNDIIEKIGTDISNVVDIVKGFKNKYSIETINLIGNNSYLSKFQKDLSTDFEITKINIVDRR